MLVDDLVFVRSAYNYDRMQASDESGLRCEDVSLAKQAFADECDINTIVRRFGLTGELPAAFKAPSYGDFEEVADFHTAMQAVRDAQESFMSMPPELRARFHNDPQELVEFVASEDNRAEAVKLKLVPEAVVEAAASLPGVGAVVAVPAPASSPAPVKASTAPGA